MIRINNMLILSTTVAIVATLHGVCIECSDVAIGNGVAQNDDKPTGNNVNVNPNKVNDKKPTDDENLKIRIKKQRVAVQGSDASSSDDEKVNLSDLDSAQYKVRFGKIKEVMNNSLGYIWKKMNNSGKDSPKQDVQPVPTTPLGTQYGSNPVPRPRGQAPPIPTNPKTSREEPKREEAEPEEAEHQFGKYSLNQLYLLYKEDGDWTDVNYTSRLVNTFEILRNEMRREMDRIDEMNQIIRQMDQTIKQLNTEMPQDAKVKAKVMFDDIKRQQLIWIKIYKAARLRLYVLGNGMRLITESIKENRPNIRNMITKLFATMGFSITDDGIVSTDNNYRVSDKDVKFEEAMGKMVRTTIGCEESKLLYYKIYNMQIRMFEFLSIYYKYTPEPKTDSVPEDNASRDKTSRDNLSRDNLSRDNLSSRDKTSRDNASESQFDPENVESKRAKKVRFRKRREVQYEADLGQSSSESGTEVQDAETRPNHFNIYTSQSQNYPEASSESSDEADSVQLNSFILFPLLLSVVLVI